jgi:tetratricopeptide (TPR) repeat protein
MKYSKFIMFNPKDSDNLLPPTVQLEEIVPFNTALELLNKNLIPEALENLQALQKQIAKLNQPLIYKNLIYQQGLCYKMLAQRGNGIANLTKALAAFQEALQLSTDNQDLNPSATIYNDLGSVFVALAEFTEKEKNNQNSIDAFNDALKLLEKGLKIYQPQKHPHVFPGIYINLTNTHLSLAQFIRQKENLNLAISFANEALRYLSVDNSPSAYALIQYNIGFAHDALSVYQEREENQQKAITAYQSAIAIYRRHGFPFEYAHTQNCLAKLYIDLAQDHAAEDHLKMAMNACKDILDVVTSIHEYPFCYATILHNLGSACKIFFKTRNKESYLGKASYYFNQILDIKELSQNSEVRASTCLNLGLIEQQFADIHYNHPSCLERAIYSLSTALQTYNMKEYPLKYAITQESLGKAYQSMAQYKNKDENLNQAMKAFKEALAIFTETDYPEDYAKNQVEMGNVFLDLCQSHYQEDSLNGAIEGYKEALKFFTSETFPETFAKITSHLGEAYAIFAIATHKNELYSIAIQTLEKVFIVYTIDAYPKEHAQTLYNLGKIYQSYSKTNNIQSNLTKTIGLFKDALAIYTFDQYPTEYANTNELLGFAYLDMAKVCDRNYHLNKAIKVFEEVLKVCSFDAHPEKHSRIQCALGNVFLEFTEGNEAKEYLQKAFSAFEASLLYYTIEQFPLEFATNMNQIGTIYKTMAEITNSFSFKSVAEFKEYKVDRISNALGAFRGALGIFKVENYPLEYAKVCFNMGEAYGLMIPVQDKREYITNAIQSYEECLKIYSPAKFPAENKKVALRLEKFKQLL